MRFWTIGHSTLAIESFIERLDAHGIRQLGDVRTIPRSRRHPQFGTEALAGSLGARGIAYRHLPGLGGLRRPRPDSANTGWTHPSFRGYADYMEQPAFMDALEGLLSWGADAPTVVMCAEAKWWQCHRRLLADALTARGHEVLHIMNASTAAPHELTPFARIEGTRVVYPGLV